MTGEIVEIHCGNPPVKYKVHKATLCAASSYFRAAFDGKFKEAGEGCIKLVDESPEILDIVLKSIYAERFDYEWRTADPFARNLLLLELYTVFDKYDLPALAAMVFDAVKESYELSNTGPSYRDITLVYQNTPESSSLRSYIVHRAAWTCLATKPRKFHPVYEKTMENIPDFAIDLSRAFFRAIGKYYDDPRTWPLQELGAPNNGANGSGTAPASTGGGAT